MTKYREAPYVGAGELGSVESGAIAALENRFRFHTRAVINFMKTMSEQDMPGAKELYTTEQPAVTPTKFIGNLMLHRKPGSKSDLPLRGYAVGALEVDEGSACTGIVYLCENLKFMVQPRTTSSNADRSNEIVTDLGDNSFYVGLVEKRTRQSDPTALVGFQRIPIPEVLNILVADNL